MIFTCECCLQPTPDIYRNVHHEWPEALGGSNDPSNLRQLCAGCHDGLHAIANILLQRKLSRSVTDQLLLIYPDNPKARENCLKLAEKVRDATIITRERGLPDNHPTEVSTTIRKKVKDVLRLRVGELRVSQEEYLRGLILQDLNKRFPSVRFDPIQERMVVKTKKS